MTTRQIRKPSRYNFLAGPASLPSCFRDETTHAPASNPPRFLSSEQVGYIISKQYFNQPTHLTPRKAEDRWCSSTLYKLMSLPSWIFSPYRRIKPGARSHSSGPIIADLKKDDFHRHFGSFGQNLDIVILDGKHRLSEFKEEHGDADIEVFLGTEAIPETRQWIKDFTPKREHFIDCLNAFYDDVNREHWHELIAAGRSAGLTNGQLRLIWRNRLHGYRFCPVQGQFILM